MTGTLLWQNFLQARCPSVKASLADAKQAIYTANKQYVQHYVHVVFLAHEPETLVAIFYRPDAILTSPTASVR